MILLITGGSGSGKSEYAERRVKESGLPARYSVSYTHLDVYKRQALIIVGQAVAQNRYERSKLYDPSFTTEYRKGEND